MSNVIDILLQADESKIKMPTMEVEVKRLSELCGQKVVFICEGITMDKFEKIKEESTITKNGVEEFSELEGAVFTLIEGVKSPNLKSKELQDKYKVPTPKDLVKKLLTPGEIDKLYSTINSLSGFNRDAIEEIKNS